MEQKTTAPGRGSPESAAWFRGMLASANLSQSGLARLLQELGDDRAFDTILRSLRRMASGEARVSGEMRGMLTYLDRTRRENHSRLDLLQRELEMMEAGRMHTFINQVDTTEQAMDGIKAQIATIHDLPTMRHARQG